MIVFIGFIILAFFAYQIHKYLFPSTNVDPRGKYVLISGCDTGFGHALAIELDKQGFHIFACLYDMTNEAALKNKLSTRATIFNLDITRTDDIDAAYSLLIKKTDTLHALVKNSGVVTSGYIDWISMETMRSTMNVNFFGHVAMTKKISPLLLVQRNSRVINVSSTSGFLATPTFAAYSLQNMLWNRSPIVFVAK
jgi:NAD(P)-dependent dehydrogenase (short-subunit alcohol dehydrogenase family)